MVVQAAVVTGGMIDRNVPEAARARIRVEVGHQPPLSHRVQHGPGCAVQAQDEQSIDGLWHGIVPNLPRTRHRAPSRAELSGPP